MSVGYVIDYCAGCGLPLKPAPLGGNYRCCADAYWSAYLPEPRDHFGYQRLTGLRPIRSVSPCEWLYPLYFYRPALGWV